MFGGACGPQVSTLAMYALLPVLVLMEQKFPPEDIKASHSKFTCDALLKCRCPRPTVREVVGPTVGLVAGLAVGLTVAPVLGLATGLVVVACDMLLKNLCRCLCPAAAKTPSAPYADVTQDLSRESSDVRP